MIKYFNYFGCINLYFARVLCGINLATNSYENYPFGDQNP